MTVLVVSGRRIEKNGGMQGSSRPDRELLDAAALCGHLLGQGSVHALLAGAPPDACSPMRCSLTCSPPVGAARRCPADVIATVMVLQALEGKSDREAVRALERDIAWKAAAGSGVDRRGVPPDGADLVAQQAAGVGGPAADLQRGAGGGGRDRGDHRQQPAGAGLDGAGRRGAAPGHDHDAGHPDPPGPQAHPRAGLGVGPGAQPGRRAGRRVDWDDPGDIDRLVTELVDDANELVWAAEDLQADGLVLSAGAGRRGGVVGARGRPGRRAG